MPSRYAVSAGADGRAPGPDSLPAGQHRPLAGEVRVRVTPSRGTPRETLAEVMRLTSTTSSASRGHSTPSARRAPPSGDPSGGKPGVGDHTDGEDTEGSSGMSGEDEGLLARLGGKSGPLYISRWMHRFSDPAAEEQYQEELWRSSRANRVAGIAYLSLFSFSKVAVLMGRASRVQGIAALVLWLLALALLAGGVLRTAPRRLVQLWTPLCASACIMLLIPLVVQGAVWVCLDPDIDSTQCEGFRAGVIFYMDIFAFVMTALVLPGMLNAHWSGCIALVVPAAVYFGSLFRLLAPVFVGQAIAFVGLGMALIVSAVRTWQRHHRTAFARELVARAALARARRAMHKRRKFQEISLQAQEGKEAFEHVLRYVCHEIRNPLHGIIGTLEQFACADDAQTAADANVCLTAGKQMSAILNDVLDLGQLQRGKMTLEPKNNCVPDLVSAGAASVASFSHVPIRVHTSDSLPDQMVLDGLRFNQILTNALSNACKATQLGHIDVYAFCGSATDLCLEVWDTGPGLQGRSGTSLFKPYSQGSQKRSRVMTSRFAKGTGLGLAITGQLVRLMGGVVTLTDREDGVVGARFRVILPIHSTGQSVECIRSQDMEHHPEAEAERISLLLQPQLVTDFHVVMINGRDSRRTIDTAGSASAGSIPRTPLLSSARLSPTLEADGAVAAAAKGDDEVKLPDAPSVVVVAGTASPTPAGIARKRRQKKQRVEYPPIGAHVLIIDDEDLNRLVLRRYSQKLKCTSRAMVDGKELLEMVADPSCRRGGDLLDTTLSPPRKIDVVFLDIMMRHTNGEEVCQAVREAGVTTSIVAATGNVLSEDMRRMRRTGFSDILLKPFTLDRLNTVLVEQTKSNGAEASGDEAKTTASAADAVPAAAASEAHEARSEAVGEGAGSGAGHGLGTEGWDAGGRAGRTRVKSPPAAATRPAAGLPGRTIHSRSLSSGSS